jgi:hypothetical protein
VLRVQDSDHHRTTLFAKKTSGDFIGLVTISVLDWIQTFGGHKIDKWFGLRPDEHVNVGGTHETRSIYLSI